MSPVQVGAQAAAPVTRPILSLRLGESVHLARVLTGAHGKHRRGQLTVLGQSLQTDIPIGLDPNLRDPQCNKGGVLTRGKGRVRLSKMRGGVQSVQHTYKRTLEPTGTTWHLNRARLCSPITRIIRWTAREPARRSSPRRRCRRYPRALKFSQ
ncbi:hypothetical protein JB92DRAFT_2833626 [Gautieria morchelliformis]|nr:hypothetical protein JB92DRAFT_2833626 [Gautieria morchelliformis]